MYKYHKTHCTGFSLVFYNTLTIHCIHVTTDHNSIYTIKLLMMYDLSLTIHCIHLYIYNTLTIHCIHVTTDHNSYIHYNVYDLVQGSH